MTLCREMTKCQIALCGGEKKDHKASDEGGNLLKMKLPYKET